MRTPPAAGVSAVAIFDGAWALAAGAPTAGTASLVSPCSVLLADCVSAGAGTLTALDGGALAATVADCLISVPGHLLDVSILALVIGTEMGVVGLVGAVTLFDVGLIGVLGPLIALALCGI